MEYGTSEHAASLTEGRHPAVRDGLQWLTYAHLPEALQKYSEIFYGVAHSLITRITTDSPELTTAINGLIAAKDSAVRAGIRHSTGRAGSVPRPQAVVNPPQLTAEKLTYDAATLDKVVDALQESGITPHQATNVIHAMQNKGILFRERA